MKRRRAPTISYRLPADELSPPIGSILMGDGPRVRRAYRILTVRQVRPGWLRHDGRGGYEITWKLAVEPMSAERGRQEIAGGTPHRTIVWDKRERRRA